MICPSCNVDKDESGFYKQSKRLCKDCQRAAKKSRYWKEPKKYREKTNEWRRSNLDKAAQNSRAYQARVMKRSPSWLTESQRQEIKDTYQHARDCSVVTGERYTVDHIVPLKGEMVSGLHVPWNLEVLPAEVNNAKGNRYWPDMFDTIGLRNRGN